MDLSCPRCGRPLRSRDTQCPNCKTAVTARAAASASKATTARSKPVAAPAATPAAAAVIAEERIREEVSRTIGADVTDPAIPIDPEVVELVAPALEEQLAEADANAAAEVSTELVEVSPAPVDVSAVAEDVRPAPVDVSTPHPATDPATVDAGLFAEAPAAIAA